MCGPGIYTPTYLLIKHWCIVCVQTWYLYTYIPVNQTLMYRLTAALMSLQLHIVYLLIRHWCIVCVQTWYLYTYIPVIIRWCIVWAQTWYLYTYIPVNQTLMYRLTAALMSLRLHCVMLYCHRYETRHPPLIYNCLNLLSNIELVNLQQTTLKTYLQNTLKINEFHY